MNRDINPRARWSVLVLCAAALLLATGPAGCGAPQTSPQQVFDDAALNVRIDRTENGAVAPRGVRPPAKHTPRAFAFEMTGVGKVAEAEASAEDRAASAQAATIDAFCNALMEACGRDPRSSEPFTVDFGPRLKVTRSFSEEGLRTTVTLISRGIETTFATLDGRLQHEPYDLRLLRQIFEATDGEFSLLAMSWSSNTGQSLATVAHYLPGGPTSVLVGDVAGNRADGMAPTVANP